MNPDRQQAIDYLRAPAGSFWRWAENGAVLVWHDGSTIAFREEIGQILEWLAPNGLPSFGAIVLLLAACKGKMPTTSEVLGEPLTWMPPTTLGGNPAVLQTVRRQLFLQLEAALAQLEKLPKLPSDLLSGLKAKCVLAEAVFEPAKAERHVDARVVLRGFHEPLNDEELRDSEGTAPRGSQVRQMHIVAEGLKLHSAESLALRLRTGLDSLPQETDVQLPTAERARRLIEELSRDREYGAVARAARELMAAVRLPRRLGEREQLAIGGVADITNRGPLDRLLLSELAHDDLTLSVRVALNEALYLRREPPMREPPGTLALLLDSGVRLWGVPRVLAMAVALALVARDKQHSEVRAWRAHQRQLLPVDLLSRHGLTQHLGALETTAHPGEALAAFAEAASSTAQSQSVLITHRDALNDPEFRRALTDHPAAPGFVAVVDREGRFELHTLPLARRPPLCEADLDLQSVFDVSKGVPPIKTEVSPDLPAVFGVTPFPFLLPLAGTVNLWIQADDGFTYAVMNDRRLVQFRNQQSGARVLASDLPAGKTMWMHCLDGTIHAVKASANQRPMRLLSLGLPDGQLRVTDLPSGSELLAVHRYGDVILTIHTHDVRAFSLNDGRLLGRALNPHRWINGRFFRQDHFYFAAWDGERVKFELVTFPRPYDASVIAQVFDRENVEGPWVVQHGGLILSSVSEEPGYKLPMPAGHSFGLDTVRVSRDGNRVYASIDALSWGGFKDLESGEARTLPPQKVKTMNLEVQPLLPVWNLYRVVESIGRLRDGLAICGRNGRWRKISLSSQETIRISEWSAEGNRPRDSVRFSPMQQTGRGCTLQRAEWPGGSKVFLDSRGLLHFKSHDPAVPEISLVLSDGDVAGWTSDGQVCGPHFFFDGPHASEPLEVFERLMHFVARL